MGDNRHYLRINLMDTDYLLPGSASFAIEKREQLEEDGTGGPVAAWWSTPGGRAPAYSIDAALNPVARDSWQRAVFLQDTGATVGLVADELQLLSYDEVKIERFRPLGAAPTRAGHLFSGAWVRSNRAPVLLFDPAALTHWLRGLEARA